MTQAHTRSNRSRHLFRSSPRRRILPVTSNLRNHVFIGIINRINQRRLVSSSRSRRRTSSRTRTRSSPNQTTNLLVNSILNPNLNVKPSTRHTIQSRPTGIPHSLVNVHTKHRYGGSIIKNPHLTILRSLRRNLIQRSRGSVRTRPSTPLRTTVSHRDTAPSLRHHQQKQTSHHDLLKSGPTHRAISSPQFQRNRRFNAQPRHKKRGYKLHKVSPRYHRQRNNSNVLGHSITRRRQHPNHRLQIHRNLGRPLTNGITTINRQIHINNQSRRPKFRRIMKPPHHSQRQTRSNGLSRRRSINRHSPHRHNSRPTPTINRLRPTSQRTPRGPNRSTNRYPATTYKSDTTNTPYTNPIQVQTAASEFMCHTTVQLLSKSDLASASAAQTSILTTVSSNDGP